MQLAGQGNKGLGGFGLDSDVSDLQLRGGVSYLCLLGDRWLRKFKPI